MSEADDIRKAKDDAAHRYYRAREEWTEIALALALNATYAAIGRNTEKPKPGMFAAIKIPGEDGVCENCNGDGCRRCRYEDESPEDREERTRWKDPER